MLNVVGPLTDPRAHGANAEDALHLVDGTAVDALTRDEILDNITLTSLTTPASPPLGSTGKTTTASST
jgi:hypothetical protein